MIRNDHDTAWKEILDYYFKDFIAYCLPELFELIDWKKKWVSLDKELQSITKGNEAGKRLLDKLFKYILRTVQNGGFLSTSKCKEKRKKIFLSVCLLMVTVFMISTKNL